MANNLKYLDQFRDILTHYRISEESKKVLAQTNLALLVAPSSGGRNTIIRELLKTAEYHYIVSDTTRQPRTNDGVPEQNGVEYWFRSEEDVLADLQAGNFLEAAIIHNQQVSGISIRELRQAQKEGKIALADIEIVGMRSIIEAKPDAHALFVLPPSFDEWMKRMDGRGHMPDDEKRRRLESAAMEFEAAIEHPYYQFVINDTIGSAVEQIHKLTIQKVDNKQQEEGKAIAQQLLTATQNWLKDR